MRYRRQTTESAGFYNTAGFNDDTRAFFSIPARHDLARRIDCAYLSELVVQGRLPMEEAAEVADRPRLSPAQKSLQAVSRLNAAALARLPAAVRRPAFDPAAAGKRHRASGDRRLPPRPSGGLHRRRHRGQGRQIGASSAPRCSSRTCPTRWRRRIVFIPWRRLGAAARYRVMGVIRQALFAPRDRARSAGGADRALHPCCHADPVGKRLLPGRAMAAWIFPIPTSPPIWPRRRHPRSAIGWLALALAAAAPDGRRPAHHPVLRQSSSPTAPSLRPPSPHSPNAAGPACRPGSPPTRLFPPPWWIASCRPRMPPIARASQAALGVADAGQRAARRISPNG